MVSYFEFLLVLISFREPHGDEDERCKFYFELFDEDGSEEISRSEFKDIVGHLLVETLGAVADEELDHVFDTVDIKHHGVLTFLEFKAFFSEIVRRSGDIGKKRPSLSLQNHEDHHRYTNYHGHRGKRSRHEHGTPSREEEPAERKDAT